jgi:hypothetical protein
VLRISRALSRASRRVFAELGRLNASVPTMRKKLAVHYHVTYHVHFAELKETPPYQHIPIVKK